MMNNALAIAAIGANNKSKELLINANNLANLNTNGFRADIAYYKQRAVMENSTTTSLIAELQDPIVDTTPGSVITTDNPLDVAIVNQGWFAIQNEDGSESYTRNGNFSVDPQGLLTDVHGGMVMGTGGPIAIPPAEQINIGRDGTISILPPGEPSTATVVIGQLKLVNPTAQDMYKDYDGYFRTRSGDAPVDSSVEVISKAVEGSNVNVVSAMVNNIQINQKFSEFMRVIETVDENQQRAISLLDITG